MSAGRDRAALVALLRLGRREYWQYAELVEEADSAEVVLRRELAGRGDQASLLPDEPEPLIESAESDIAEWQAKGLRLLGVLDGSYPCNLRRVHDRPPLIFVAGDLKPEDARSVAVIGSRRASKCGLETTAEIAEHLVASGHTVISGLAAGVDTAAHTAALSLGGRTTAVIGTGLANAYPPENAWLQDQIARRGAVVSQFWPDSPPSRTSFPLRNAVMSGLSLGTVVVEGSARSGARIQARIALGHGRPVFLWGGLLEQAWARELATRPGVHVVAQPDQITRAIERLNATELLAE